MAEKHRLRLGLIFNFNPKWTGGIVYLQNIAKLLNYLDVDDRPDLYLFFRPELEEYVEDIQYPYLNKIMWPFQNIRRGYLLSYCRMRNIFVHRPIKKYNLDKVFPLHDFPLKSRENAKLISWYADLQHMYYPEFFSWKKRIERNMRIHFILRYARHLVVSSESVRNDFYKFFKIPEHLKIHIFHFVSIIENLPDISKENLLQKYNLPSDYFIICNQFHKHKNHKVAFEALARLGENGKSVRIAVTGRFPKNPNSDYLKNLYEIIEKHELKVQVSFLGLIPRGDQLLLMKHARAVIQPSLFEGWSTVIEDAKSLQIPVIASDIPVNREQLESTGVYFSPHDAEGLSEILKEFPVRDHESEIYEPYKDRIRNAAYKFLSIVMQDVD